MVYSRLYIAKIRRDVWDRKG